MMMMMMVMMMVMVVVVVLEGMIKRMVVLFFGVSATKQL